MTKNEKLALIIAISASGVAFLDSSVINVALPAISSELGEGITLKQWVVDAYLITLGSFILLAGSLSDLFGRKKILSLGLWGFAAASILCAIAPSGAFLIIARALQGVAGALLVPSSLALIITVFKKEQQGKAIGSWTAWTGVAFIIGPLLGGILVDSASWRWIFAINILPIAVILWMMKTLDLKDNIIPKAKVDIKGAILGAVGLGLPVYALIEQSNYGWDSPLIVGALILGLICLSLFIRHEARTQSPMLPLELFKIRNFMVGNIATFLIYGSLSIITFALAVFVQEVGGYSALQAGLTLLPVTIIMFLLSSKFGALSDKYGPRLFMSLGPFISAIGIFTMLMTSQNVNFFSELLPGILIFSIGLSITVAPLTTAILTSIDTARSGIGSAVNNAVARIAGLITIATLGFVTADKINLEGFHNSIYYMATLLILGGLVSAVGIENKKASKKIG